MRIQHEMEEMFRYNQERDEEWHQRTTMKIEEVTIEKKVFKGCVCYFHQIFIFSSNDSPSKTMKNAFYFI